MAWTAPKTWDETLITAAMLNVHIRDNLLALDQHAHSGASGDGSPLIDTGATWTGQTSMPLSDNPVAPAALGEIKRIGDDLRYFNGVVVQLSDDAAVDMPSVRTLGTGATQAAAGNHTH